ncbi:hypothetical protein [Kineococcus rhizosphaerae]|uniref:Tetratricopeptide repeat protein n=1 Tax=Kineococcus rhizosphaerae TaxID=559628 RepID=A0A2T0R859_9ACTN|nr:hypothetical protein [Kineococcus rhizosphaerae]PRY17328.1 hypothetical protein CLV37_102288 [Kineococcus rhizosphaerae]
MRPRTRRRLVAVPLLAVLPAVVALKLLTLGPVLEHRPDLLRVADVVEPWKSSLARGDARFAAGDLPGAAAQFATGLRRAPDDGSRCRVRVNLALTQLLQAQAALDAGKDDGLALMTTTAATTDDRSGERCAAADEKTLADVSEAARQAQAQAQLPDLPGRQATPVAPPEGAPPAVPDQEDLDALARDAQQGAAERSAQGSRDAYAGDDFRMSSTPW